MDHKKLADLLFPDVAMTRDELEKKYPKRDAVVTRIGPSPTGFVHLGNLYNAIIAERLAHQNGGVFFLRIEDTDGKREVPGAVDIVISAMRYFGILFDEGAVQDGDRGAYGPYRQKQRRDIYHVYAKYLVENGWAYPCFCSEERLAEIREVQMKEKQDIGYYGKWAACRDLTFEEIEEKIRAGQPYVLRFRADAAADGYIEVEDAIRGTLRMPENRLDFVLLKSDGIPTYHFAHVVDDHLMRTTYVVRGEEWLSSLPMHVQMFETLGWKHPVYCHTATLMKMDGTSKRKLSKRKDPELSLEYYRQEGFPVDAIWDYMLTTLNSNFEEWKTANPGRGYPEFPFTLEKMSNSGALFDLDKLIDISKEHIAALPAEKIYSEWHEWAQNYRPDFAKILEDNSRLAMDVLKVGRQGKNIRKDIYNWRQACEFASMYFDETFSITDERSDSIENGKVKYLLEKYLETYSYEDDQEAWFAKVKQLTEEIGCAVRPKDYKKNPENYAGSIVDVTNILRIALMGRSNAPDLWEVSKAYGAERVQARIRQFMEAL